MGEPLIRVGSGAPDLGIDPGTYPAVLVGIKERTISSEFGENQPMLEWQFEIPTDDPDSIIPVAGLTSMFTGPKSKTYKFLTALLGHVNVNDEFLETDLIGKQCLVVLTTNAQGWLKVSDVTAMPRTMGSPRAGAPVGADTSPRPAGQVAGNPSPPAPTRAPARQTVRAAAGAAPVDLDDLPF